MESYLYCESEWKAMALRTIVTLESLGFASRLDGIGTETLATALEALHEREGSQVSGSKIMLEAIRVIDEFDKS